MRDAKVADSKRREAPRRLFPLLSSEKRRELAKNRAMASRVDLRAESLLAVATVNLREEVRKEAQVAAVRKSRETLPRERSNSTRRWKPTG